MSTVKQQKVASILLEKGGSMGAAMREAGYGAGTAKNPQKLTYSKGWKELIDKFLPTELLLERHKELLNKREIVKLKNKVITDQPHSDANKALDMAYKLKGNYAPQKSAHLNIVVSSPMKEMSDEELMEIAYPEHVF